MEENDAHLDTCFIDLTQACNLRCWFCYDAKHRSAHHMNTRDISTAMRDLYAFGVRTLIYLGGEPTLHPDLVKILKYGDKIGFQQCIITNGQLSSNDMLSQWSMIPSLTIGVSVHSDCPEIHDKITGIQGSHFRVQEFLRKLEKYNITWYAQTSLTSLNFQHLCKLHEFLQSFGTPLRMDLSRMVNSASSNTSEDRFLTEREYIDVFRQINSLADEGVHVRMEAFPRCWLRKISESYGFNYDNLRRSVRPCFALARQVSIDIYGNARLCPTGGASLGNIFSEGIEAVWHSAYADRLRTFSWLPKHCQKCHDFRFCYGACKMTKGTEEPARDPLISNEPEIFEGGSLSCQSCSKTI